MARVRSDAVYELGLGSSLTAAATTITETFITNLPVVTAPDVAALTLDPLQTYGAREVVWVTAHTAGSNTATISRGQEGTVARSHVIGEAAILGPTAYDWNLVDQHFFNAVAYGMSLTATDNTAAIQAAINDAHAVNGGVVFIPSSHGGSAMWRFASTLYMYSDVVLRGAGKQLTFLQYTGTGTAIMMQNGTTTPPTLTEYVGLEGFTLYSSNAAAVCGIDLYCVQRSRMYDVRITNFTNAAAVGLKVHGYRDATAPTTASVANQLNKFIDCEVYGSGQYNLDSYVNGYVDKFGAVTDNTWLGCYFTGPDNTAPATNVHLQSSCDRQNFVGCFFYHAANNVIEVHGESDSFIACSIEFSAGSGLWFTSDASRCQYIGGRIVASNIAGTALVDNGTGSTWFGVDYATVAGSPLDSALGGHLISNGVAPGIAVATALGTTGTATVAGNDRTGLITLTPGGTGITNGIMATLTFAFAFRLTPKVVHVTPQGFNAANAMHPYSINLSTTQWAIGLAGTPVSGTVYTFQYTAEG